MFGGVAVTVVEAAVVVSATGPDADWSVAAWMRATLHDKREVGAVLDTYVGRRMYAGVADEMKRGLPESAHTPL